MHLTISSVNYRTSTLYNYLIFFTGAASRVYPLITMWILLMGVMDHDLSCISDFSEILTSSTSKLKDETITRISISIQSPRRSKILIHDIFLYFCSQFVPHWFVCLVRQCNTVMYSPNVTSDVCVVYLCTLLLNCYLLLLKLLMTKKFELYWINYTSILIYKTTTIKSQQFINLSL